MNYNTSSNKLSLREYGRNVQKLIEHAIHIEDKEARNRFAQGIIELMGNLNPHLKNVEDFKHMLWDHLFIISDFKLDVDSPYPKIDSVALFKKPEPLEYPQKKIEYKHYGSYIKAVIDKAVDLDEEVKAEMSKYIASYMKLVHRSWNNETVNDEIVKNDLVRMSNGKLKLEDDENIRQLMKTGNNGPNNTNRNNPNNNRNNNNSNNNNKKRKNKNRSNNYPNQGGGQRNR